MYAVDRGGDAGQRRSSNMDVVQVNTLQLSRQLHETRLNAYTSEVPSPDWIVSMTVPIHAACSNASFCNYTAFESYVTFGKTGTLKVEGFGTASFVPIVNGKKQRQQNLFALHIPSLTTNVFSVQRYLRKTSHSLQVTSEQALIYDDDGIVRLAGKVQEGVYSLKVAKDPNATSVLKRGFNRLHEFEWPLAERHAWEKKVKDVGKANCI